MTKTKVYVVKLNNVKGRVVCEDAGLMEALYRKFSIYIDKYYFNPKVKSGLWDGKINFVKRNGTFDNGLLEDVINYLKCQKEYEIDLDPLYEKADKSILDTLKDKFIEISTKLNCPFAPYSHQLKGAFKCVFYKRCILEHCTSSGKSLTQALLVNFLLHSKKKHKFLVLVPRVDLVNQLADDYKEYGIPADKIGKFYSEEKDIDKDIVISTWQSIYRKKKLLKQFTVLMCDEAHGLKAEMVRGVAEGTTNANLRYGFTGTLPDHICEKTLIVSILGPVVDVVKAEDLQKLKIISDIKIDIPFLIYKPDDIKNVKRASKGLDGRAAYEYEKNYIIEHPRRNKLISKISKKFTDKGENILILANRHTHIDKIKEELIANGMEPYIVTGNTKPKERNEIKKKMELEGGRVLLATSGVYSTGISIKRLHAIIFANAGKSKIETLQSVGRGLRLHHSKTKLHLYDLADNLKYSEDHLQERMEYYARNNFEVEIKEVNL